MTRERRFYVEDLDSETLALSSEESHHLVQVLRLREGAEVSLFDGKGRAAKAEVVTIGKTVVTLRSLSSEPSRESSLSLTVAVSPPKGDRMSVLVQKLTELGVHRIVPIAAERGRDEKSLERWRRIALEACKQSGRSLLPHIDEPCDLAALVRAKEGFLLAAHPGAPPLARLEAPRIIAFVGPEGGWSKREMKILTSSKVTLFGLGPRTLRTETAAISVATLLQYLVGDLT
ncbi:MAG: RsmE family RNA methyltransferase [Vicinamibacteria bacterium]